MSSNMHMPQKLYEEKITERKSPMDLTGKLNCLHVREFKSLLCAFYRQYCRLITVRSSLLSKYT